ncbi:MAG TPA: hypothetical protein PKX92_04955 [Edaphocola sp.]|nr:hypothetical protein [Edaphocola sp.]
MSIFGCQKPNNKENFKDNIKKINSEGLTYLPDSTENAVTQSIIAMHQKLKDIKNNDYIYTGTTSIDTFEFYLEGIFNYNISQPNFDDNPIISKFEFPVSLNNGAINYSEFSKTFYQIKDSIVAKLNSISGNKKGVGGLNVSLKEKTSSLVTLSVDISFWSSLTGSIFSCDEKLFIAKDFETTEPAFVVGTAYDFNTGIIGPSKGEGTMNHNTKSITNIDNTKPGALYYLRRLGVGNYNHWYCNLLENPCGGYFVDVKDNGYSYSSSANAIKLSSPISNYKMRNIPSYENNEDMFLSFIFYSNPSTVNDPYLVYKGWLTKPMINFYVKRIPYHINKAINYIDLSYPPIISLPGIPVPTRTLMNLNFEELTCATCAISYHPEQNSHGRYRELNYLITAGIFIRNNCNDQKVPLSNL